MCINPSHFLTSGRLFGMIRVRNARGLRAVLLTGIPILQLPFSDDESSFCLITLPLGVFGVVGIDGDSLSEFVFNWCRWLIREGCSTAQMYRRQTKYYKSIPAAPSAPDSLDIELVQKPVKHSRRTSGRGILRNSRTENLDVDLDRRFNSVRNIQNGIIHLSDGRYIKILRWSRSIFSSQFVSKSIIASFAS
ncbi:MAG: hypothetical protein ACLSB9_35440 [Hydrogeniiclostridium mannosilyticum]